MNAAKPMSLPEDFRFPYMMYFVFISVEGRLQIDRFSG